MYLKYKGGLLIQELNLISPICPSVNHYIKPRIILIKNKPRVSLYETDEAKQYKKNFKKYVQEQVKLQKYSLIPNKERHFYIDCVFYFDRIDRDANNYFKLLLDAITETQLVWLDDNVTCERVNRIYYDSNNPRIELKIYPTHYIGIFDNIAQLENFELHCSSCNRYRRNCSLLKKAKKGHIQKEIHNGICEKYKE